MSPKQQRGEATVDRLPDAALRLYAESCDRGPNAIRLHAALVSGLRDAGWRSVAYR